MKKIFFLFSILNTTNLVASISVLHTHKKIETISFKKACDEKFVGSSLLVEKLNSSEIDCTGHKLNVYQVCEGKKIDRSSFSRAIIADDGDIIFCEYATTVKVTIPCSSKVLNGYCEDESKSCEKLRKIYAHDLVKVHSGFIYEYAKKSGISCYYKFKS